MQVLCQVKEKKRNSKMDRLLGKYIDSGVVVSVRQLSGDNQVYRIVLASSASKENEVGIQKALAKSGYRTRVHRQGQGMVHRRSGSVIVHGSKYGINPSVGCGRILLAKTNYPQQPDSPGSLPDPGGKKPKKRK